MAGNFGGGVDVARRIDSRVNSPSMRSLASQNVCLWIESKQIRRLCPCPRLAYLRYRADLKKRTNRSKL